MRRNALHLFAALPKWTSLILLLRVLAASDGDERQIARRGVDVWIADFNRNLIAPSADEARQVRVECERLQGDVDDRTLEMISFLASPIGS